MGLFLLVTLTIFLCLCTVEAIPQICVENDAAISLTNTSQCPTGQSAFKAVGVNIYDLLWNAW